MVVLIGVGCIDRTVCVPPGIGRRSDVRGGVGCIDRVY